MNYNLSNIANRFVICGIEELDHFLNHHNISLVISACSEEECKLPVSTTNGNVSAQSLIDKATLQGVEQYQSLLYQTYGQFLDRYTPEPMSEEEEQSYFYGQAEATLDEIEKALNDHPDKKIIIHCVYGSDRSAIVAIAYFLKHQRQNADIDEALRTLQKLRPDARLEGISEQFRGYFGRNFETYRQAIIDYRDTLEKRSEIPRGTLAQDFFMSSDPSGDRWNSYSETCKRFGIDPNRSL